MSSHRFGVLMTIGLCAFGLAAGGWIPVSAQGQQNARKLDVSFNQGLVTIQAENVTVREILQAWGRVGGSRIVNAEKLAGPVLPYVEFKDRPEAEVLRSLLRDVPGYGAAPRLATSERESTFEAVFILASRSVAVSNTPVPASPAASTPRPQPLVPQQGDPESQPRPIEGSVDAEIPPVRPVQGDLPPTTPGASTNPNIRTGPGGMVTSTIPGVIIPTTPDPATAPPPTGSGNPPSSGGRGRGGGGGGGLTPSV